MRVIILIGLLLFASSTYAVQNAGDWMKKAMEKEQAAMAMMANKSGGAAIELYKDAQLTQPMNAINDGDSKFFVKAKFDKSKVSRLGSYQGKTDCTLILKANGYKIYRGKKSLGKSIREVAKKQEAVVFEVDLRGDGGDLEGFLSSSSSEEAVLQVEAAVEAVKYKSVAEGMLTMDLSNGKSKYMGGALDAQANYTFNHTAAFTDEKHQNLAINYLNDRVNVKVNQFVWTLKGEESLDDRVYYKKYMAKLTYTNLDDSQCREGTVEYWMSRPVGSSTYDLYSVTLLTGNATLIPCDRANK